MSRRDATPATNDWQHLALRFTDPIQRIYEVIRPVVLFGAPVHEQVATTGTPERTVYRYLERFTARGMRGLQERDPPTHTLPPHLRQLIVTLKAEYPPLRIHELQTICYVRTGRRPDAKTVKRVLATTPLPLRTQRRFPPYHAIPNPIDRRRAVIRLHMEGWTVTSIGEYLQVHRKTVQRTLKRWAEEGVHGLPNKRRARRPGGRKVTLQTLRVARHLQMNPGLGQFRLHAKLAQLGITVSPRTCGRILALNRALYGLPKPKHAPRTPQAMPFAAQRRHQFWSIDIRYLDTPAFNRGQVYCISILDNYSRAMLASTIAPRQDASVYVQVLYAAIAQFGSPEGIVSDGGGVFKATHVLTIYARLGITRHQIDRGQAWQNYIETAWNIQRRLGDYHFANAATWPDLQAVHQQWMDDYNAQAHWAHRQREDGRRSPEEVLGRVFGRTYPLQDLHRTFYTLRFQRRFDLLGYVRFRQWRIYGEYGVARQTAVVWLYGETLTVACGDIALAVYRVSYQPDLKHLRTLTEPQLFDTCYRSPQQPLWELGEHEWLKVVRMRPVARQARHRSMGEQAVLPLDGR